MSALTPARVPDTCGASSPTTRACSTQYSQMQLLPVSVQGSPFHLCNSKIEKEKSLPLPRGSSGGTVKRELSRTVISKSRQHQNKQKSQPVLLLPGLTLQPCSTAGSAFLGMIPPCFPPATAGNQGTSVLRIALGGQRERPGSQLLLGFAGRG